MPKQLGLGFLVLCLSTSVFVPGCSSRTQTMESMEVRLAALEEAQHNFQARQESLNQWESMRLSGLEAKHPEIEVPPPPAFISRETILPADPVNETSPLQGGVVDVEPGQAVVAPSALVSKPASTPDPNAGMIVYHAPANPASEAATQEHAGLSPQPAPAPPSNTMPDAPVEASTQQPAQAVQVVTSQPQIEALGGRAIDPNAAPAPLGKAEAKPAETATRQPAAKPTNSASSAGSGEKGEYASALAQIERGQYQQGRTGMDDFMTKYPSSSLIPNALYWKGESYYSEKKYDEAILSFKDIVSRFPKSNKAPDAMLKMGMSYQKMGDNQNARFYLQLLINDYPSARSAGLAGKQLAGLPE